MSRTPFASSSKDTENTDTESALSDDELDGVVGGRDPVLGGAVCTHGRPSPHNITGGGRCEGPFNQRG
jgi:hypothetical protein